MFRFLPGLLAAVAAALLLSACYPEYNWREVQVADGRAIAMFPARVHTEDRLFDWADGERRFTMSTATVGKAVYAAGHMVLGEEERSDPEAQRAWVERLVQGLYANFQAEPPATLPAAGQEILIEGVRPGGEPMRLVARVEVIGGALVEAVAAGPSEALPLERAREFVASLKPAG